MLRHLPRVSRRVIRRIAVGTLSVLAASALTLGIWIACPIPRAMLAPPHAPSITLEDRHGLVLRTTRASDGSRSRWMPLREIDPQLITAFIAVEDRRFFAHGALDWRAIARAARDNLRAHRVVSGASTITMQTARLLHPAERTLAGKVVQVLWALRLSAHLDRQQILEQYLNRVHLGQGAVGVASAAALYFGATARELSLGEAALLAGIAHAPSNDNPFVAPARARARRAVALDRMRSAGYTSPVAVARAAREPIAVPDRATPFLAPHFTTRVLQWRSRELGGSGAGEWRTSLDLALQEELEAEVRRTVDDLRDRGGLEAAIVVLANRTGEILAWVGSPDFWSDSAGQTDMVISPRQPGSALKPFLYGLAFDHGYTPATILADIPHTYRTSTGPYRPRNYDRQYHGPVRAREALASSYNVPAVELADRLGTRSVLEVLRQAGFASLSRSADYYGLGLALGNGDVTLLELANAYRALANGGVWRPYTWRVADAGTAARGPERRVISARAAALVLDILSDPDARIPGFGLESPLDFPFPAAAKTGTSRHFTDNWAVATTGGFTVAVWVGNFTGRPMEGVSGVSGAGPLLHHAVMRTVARYAPGELPSPASVGAVPVEICRLSGLRAANGCPHLTEWFIPGTAPTALDDWYQNGRVVLPPVYAEWVEQRARELGQAPVASVRGRVVAGGGGTGGSSAADTVMATVGSEVVARTAGEARAGFHITSPLDGDRYQVPPGVDARFATIALRAAGTSDLGSVRWFVDGRPWARPRLPLTRGEHVIRARAGNGSSDQVTITVE
jgi:penicillin-binding protein 1C